MAVRNIKSIRQLTETIGELAKDNRAHLVYEHCNILLPLLNKIDTSGFKDEDLVSFLSAKHCVEKWAKDIRGARLEAWGDIGAMIVEACMGYSDPNGNMPSRTLISSFCGGDFVEYFGEEFCDDLVALLDNPEVCDTERKREIAASLWRYYEPRRREIQQFNRDADRVVGLVANNMSVRHENEKQWTEAFLASNSPQKYDELLFGVITTMMAQIALKHKVDITLPRLKTMLEPCGQ